MTVWSKDVVINIAYLCLYFYGLGEGRLL